MPNMTFAQAFVQFEIDVRTPGVQEKEGEDES